MEKTIQELIESATVNGNISEDEKSYIMKRANEIGIDEMEVNIFIKAYLNKNSSKSNVSDISTESLPASTEGWIKLKEFKFSNLIMVLGSILIFISGFFPWIESSVTASGMGEYYNDGASANAGFVYSLPLGIMSILFAFKRNLIRFSSFYGLFVILTATYLAYSYETSQSYSAFGMSASASTGAGPGVVILGISGLIFLIGSLLNSSLVKFIFTNEYTMILYLFAITYGVYTEYDRLFDTNFFAIYSRGLDGFLIVTIVYSMLNFVLPYLITKKLNYNRSKYVILGSASFWVLSAILPVRSNVDLISFLIVSVDGFKYVFFFSYIILITLATTLDFTEKRNASIFDYKKVDKFFNINIILLFYLLLVIISFIFNVFN